MPQKRDIRWQNISETIDFKFGITPTEQWGLTKDRPLTITLQFDYPGSHGEGGKEISCYITAKTAKEIAFSILAELTDQGIDIYEE